MPEELQFISFSTKKHVDAGTLSRIRSHAQQRVQDQKWSKRARQQPESSAKAAKEAENQNPQFLKLVFEQKSGKQIKRQEAVPIRHATRTKKSPKGEQAVVKRESHSLSASPAERPDPFAAFPVPIDAELFDLFEGYLQGWKWTEHAKATMFNENAVNPALVHSFLAIANQVWKNDEVKSQYHENKTIVQISKDLPKLNALTGHDRIEAVGALMWAIIRLCTIKVNQGRLEESLVHLNALATISPTMEEWRTSKFAPHFESAIASLVLANFSHSDRVQPLLHLPFGPMNTRAVDDVQSQGFMVPQDAAMLQPACQDLLPESVTDAILALTALYNTAGSTTDTSLPHVHAGKAASLGIKAALRLAKQTTPRSSPLDDWDWLHEFQECVRLSALLFTWTFGRKVVNLSEAILSAQRYIRAFLTEDIIHRALMASANSQAVMDLALWLLLINGSAASIQADTEHFAELIRTFVPGASYTPYTEIRKLGTRLPWIETANRSSTEEFWDSVTMYGGTPESQNSTASSNAPGWLLQGYASVTSTPRPPSSAS
ncbi:hypothetical protein HII31_05909 [Pseudocercospora fuligena]|uniref:Uncharacterized protein n=1 Tax=Pseudocercospora fuligena TaxID=685502 RepID=A0A8H6RKE6_9PEZI|nr:hypothetical protein HII31_05909 [Pseudocercospora fuligena]